MEYFSGWNPAGTFFIKGLLHPCVFQQAKCDSNPDVKTHARNDWPSAEKYITEPYFEIHVSFVDSSFINFIENELPLGFRGVLQEELNLILRLSDLQCYLTGEGSHRRLSSSIKLSGQLESKAELPRHSCKAIIIEKLPSRIFADPFELQHLLQRGVFTDVAVFGDTNLELPSVVSNRSIVEVHIDVDLNIVSGHNNGLEIDVEVSLHARYPPLGEHGFATVEFSRADLFLCCNIDEKSHDDNCLFMVTGSSDESQSVVWEIPCGITEHSRVVSIVTFVSAVVVAFLIVLTSIYYLHNQKSQ
ncbi:uncharacterized protein LOC131307725 isoform X1 [Rhododendron vialii]|uniref:uncharacterized protein LOC131307725 isoform X1 n=1 Tax=Rhododendron vialii TaxID=182163 RepID=UPI00265EF327|nr:uncharacterized protein LOC131307725 isoform X1 [Rhododendron vialii]